MYTESEERHEVSWRDRTHRALPEKKMGLEKRIRTFASFDEWFQHFWSVYDSAPESLFLKKTKFSSDQVYDELQLVLTSPPFQESVLLFTIAYMCLYSTPNPPSTFSTHTKSVFEYWIRQGATHLESPFFCLQLPRYMNRLLRKKYKCIL